MATEDHWTGLFSSTNIASAVMGGLSALFALGVAPPATHREGLCRVGFGLIAMFVLTEPLVYALHLPATPTISLCVALVVGSFIWYVFAAFVMFGKHSSSSMVRWIVKKFTGMELPESGGGK